MKNSPPRFLRVSVLSAALLITGRFAQAAASSLWGASGELWSPASRLPDFSRAGYRGGESPIPDVPVRTNVKDFGAIGNGIADDSNAFLNALKATENGAVFIPAGRYKITKQINIAKSNVVFRGAGRDVTTLYFPKPLNDAVGPAATYAPGGSWSWSGGFFQVAGYNNGSKLASVVTAAKRGDTTLIVSKTSGMSVGQRIRVITWNTDGSWGDYLFANQHKGPAELIGTKGSDFPCKIVAIAGNTLTLDRPLRTDIRLSWNPEITSDLPALQEIGFEDMTLEFPDVPYAGHHDEPGFNGFDLRTVENCWIRRVRFVNCDSGIFIHESSWFCTIQSVRFSAAPNRFVTGYDYLPDHPWPVAGHHGIVALSYAMDNLFSDFHFDMRMIHELSVENQSVGNVFEAGDGLDMVLDHHRRAPYGNLFTDIDAGIGNRLWEAGGDAADGPECAAWETYWNVRAGLPQSWPAIWDYSPVLMNLVGVTTSLATSTPVNGNWIEAIPPASLAPPDLYLAQVAYRKGGSSGDTTAPSVPAGLSAAVVSSAQIDLSWSASSDNVGVAGYKIFVNGNFLAATAGASYSHKGLSTSTAYTYTVAAYDAAGNASALSAPVTATTPAAPPVVTSAGTAAGTLGVAFSYAITATNNPSGFNATGLPSGLSVNAKTGVISGTPAAVGVSNIALSATNASGTGVKTLTLTIASFIDTTAPSVPAGLSAVAVSSRQINLSWSASTDPDDAVAGYVVYRYGVKIGLSTKTVFYNGGLTPSTLYKYSVSAYDTAGNQSARSITRSATTQAPPVVAPEAPTGLTAAAVSSSQIDLSWNASTAPQGAIAGYRVFRDGVQIASAPAASFPDSGLTPATTYTYRISAYDTLGTISALSISAAAMTFSAPLVSPPPDSIILPLPALSLPAYLPVNGTLEVDYPSGYAGVEFQWTLTLNAPAGNLPAGQAGRSRTASPRGSAGPSPAPAASFKTPGHAANLAGFSLAPGPYLVSVQAFDGNGNTSPIVQAPVTLVSADLSGIRVYPNPWRSDKHAGVAMTYDRLPLGSTLRLFTVSGHLLHTLTSSSDTIRWNLTNDSGDPVGSGLYLYLITAPDGQKAKGKFAVIK